MPDIARDAGPLFVVDDDPAICQLLSILFSKEGFAIVCFADGASLMAELRAQSPACIILDVHIPGKSGLDILKEMNTRSYAAPVLIMSGKGDIAMAVEAIKNGALDFIEKPFRGSDVVERVREAIEADRRLHGDQSAPQDLPFHFPSREPLTARAGGAGATRHRRHQ